MKFMDKVMTQDGEGLVVAREMEGKLLVALGPREVRVEGKDGKMEVKRTPGPNVLMSWCEAHAVWFNVACIQCQEVGGD